MTLGESIRRVRKKAGLTQAELANRLGISAAGIAQWENNIRNPKLETIKRIASALGVSQFELLRPVMENDADFVYSDWFGEMTDEDIIAAVVPPSEKSTEENPPKKKVEGIAYDLYDAKLLPHFHRLQNEDKEKVISYCQWLVNVAQHPTKSPQDAAGNAPEDTAPKKD